MIGVEIDQKWSQSLIFMKYQSGRQAYATILKEEGATAFWKDHMAAQYLSVVYMTFQFYGVDLFTRKPSE